MFHFCSGLLFGITTLVDIEKKHFKDGAFTFDEATGHWQQGRSRAKALQCVMEVMCTIPLTFVHANDGKLERFCDIKLDDKWDQADEKQRLEFHFMQIIVVPEDANAKYVHILKRISQQEQVACSDVLRFVPRVVLQIHLGQPQKWTDGRQPHVQPHEQLPNLLLVAPTQNAQETGA